MLSYRGTEVRSEGRESVSRASLGAVTTGVGENMLTRMMGREGYKYVVAEWLSRLGAPSLPPKTGGREIVKRAAVEL